MFGDLFWDFNCLFGTWQVDWKILDLYYGFYISFYQSYKKKSNLPFWHIFPFQLTARLEKHTYLKHLKGKLEDQGGIIMECISANWKQINLLCRVRSTTWLLPWFIFFLTTASKKRFSFKFNLKIDNDFPTFSMGWFPLKKIIPFEQGIQRNQQTNGNPWSYAWWVASLAVWTMLSSVRCLKCVLFPMTEPWKCLCIYRL